MKQNILVVLLFLERIELAILGMQLVPEHRRLEHVAGVAVLLKHGLIEYLKAVHRLIVERHQLYAARPKVYGREVGRVEAARVRITSDELRLGVTDDVVRALLAHLFGLGLVHRGHLMAAGRGRQLTGKVHGDAAVLLLNCGCGGGGGEAVREFEVHEIRFGAVSAR